ncbi:MAG: hypothetical protein HRU20_26720 [Pseudomonadales bacterium]|nr:hypothetical protein [Pseudomonadales bacterium]
MNEHVSYAMRNNEATESLIYFNSPSELLSWSHLSIELIIYAGVLLALIHAFRTDKKEGGSQARITLLNCFIYGLTMDILSYYTVENFWHGEFSVMFLFNKLPLYIACFYPAFMYHACMLIKRYQFTPRIEAICTGFFAGLMYLIFDNLGPQMGWWIWQTSDPTTLPYVSSVPLTSYHWFFTFTIAFALINRVICEKLAGDTTNKSIANKAKLIAAVALQPTATILLGSLFFIPYNLFAKNMPPYDMLPWAQNLTLAAFVHVITFSAAGWIFLQHWRKPQMGRDQLLMVFPFIYLASHAYMFIASYSQMSSANAEGFASNGLAAGNPIAVILAIVGSAFILLATQSNTDQTT